MLDWSKMPLLLVLLVVCVACSGNKNPLQTDPTKTSAAEFVGPAGPAGPVGPQGPKGDQGDPAPLIATTCPTNFTEVAPHLCITSRFRTALKYVDAQNQCRLIGSHICNYSEIYVAWPTDLLQGQWIGNRANGQNDALTVLGTNRDDFDTPININLNTREYHCCISPSPN